MRAAMARANRRPDGRIHENRHLALAAGTFIKRFRSSAGWAFITARQFTNLADAKPSFARRSRFLRLTGNQNNSRSDL